MSPEKHILTANERPTTSVIRAVTGKSYNKRKIIDALDTLSEKELSQIVDKVINLDKLKSTVEKKEETPQVEEADGEKTGDQEPG